MLLSWMPVPGTMIALPSPVEHVTLQAFPRSSRTEMCVVEPMRDARKRSTNPSSASPSRNSGVRSACAASITATISSGVAGPSVRSRR